MATSPRKGLVPCRKVGSAPDNKALSPYKIASAYGTTLGLGDPVKLNTDGTIVKATNGADAIGIFHGVRYVDAAGNIKIEKAWIAGTVATEIEALVLDDPMASAHVVADGPVAGVLVGDIYAADLSAADAATGRSTVTVSVAPTIVGDVAVPLTTLVGVVAGLADGDAFTIETANPANTPVTITIATATTGQQLLDALNAVPGILATRQAGTNYLVIKSTDGYGLTLASTVQTPVADLFVATSFTNQRQTVAANAGLVKVLKVEDLENNVLEVVLVNHSLRDDG